MQENDHYIDYGCSLLIAEPVSIDKEKDGVLPKMFFRVVLRKLYLICVPKN
jgi:hypothetical protein